MIAAFCAKDKRKDKGYIQIPTATIFIFLFVRVFFGRGKPSGYSLLSVTGSHQGFVLRKGIWVDPISARLTLVEVANVWSCKCHTVSLTLYHTEVALKRETKVSS
jgi:hypothetical protein